MWPVACLCAAYLLAVALAITAVRPAVFAVAVVMTASLIAGRLAGWRAVLMPVVALLIGVAVVGVTRHPDLGRGEDPNSVLGGLGVLLAGVAEVGVSLGAARRATAPGHG